MDLNLFENLKTNSNATIKNFMEDLSDFLKNKSSNNSHDKHDSIRNTNEPNAETTLDENVEKHRKEGHLYLVTEDRNNEIYLWDFTDKPKYEFKEVITSKELLSVAKEGAMLQYKNGKYELYSPYGFDMLYNEKNQK